MLQNNASDDHAGRAIIHIGVCPQNISVSASSFFPCSLSLLLVLSHQCLLITYIFLACWDLSIIWGFWALVEQKTSLSLQCTLGFFMLFSFSLCYFLSFPPYTHLLHSNPPVSFSRIYLQVLVHAALVPAAITVSLCVWQTTACDGFGAAL